MLRREAKSWFIGCLVILLLAATTLVSAQQRATPRHKDGAQEKAESPDSAGLILVDAFLLRPLGIAATVLGTATFIITLPFSLPTRSVDVAAKVLVAKPARYTFARTLGEVEP